MGVYGVVLVDDDDNVVDGPVNVLDVAQPFFQSIPWWNEPGVYPRLLLVLVPGDENDLPGEPLLRYRSCQVGYTQVSLTTREKVLYRHPHTVGEVLEKGLREWIGRMADGGAVAGYRLTGLDDLRSSRTTPEVEGATDFEPYAEGEGPSFRIRPLPPTPPPPTSLTKLGAGPVNGDWTAPSRTDFVKVLVDESVHDDLCKGRSFSDEVEEGGFLVGKVFEDEDDAGTYITEVKGALAAQRTGASFLHFTFTGDSFRDLNEILDRERPGERILGWYHTHLFAATDDFGLSSIDFRLHFLTFTFPWQLAGLVNIDSKGQRVLRFYVRRDDTMALCPHQAFTIP